MGRVGGGGCFGDSCGPNGVHLSPLHQRSPLTQNPTTDKCFYLPVPHVEQGSPLMLLGPRDPGSVLGQRGAPAKGCEDVQGEEKA